jgi:hypothetical protein
MKTRRAGLGCMLAALWLASVGAMGQSVTEFSAGTARPESA